MLSQPNAPLDRRPRKTRLRRAGLWSLVTVLALALVAGGGIIWLLGKPILAPDWARDRIETRLAQVLPEARVQFGEVEVVVDEGWRPRVRVRDVAVAAPDGTPIVEVRELKASLSMRALLQRQIEPRAISLTGILASLRRGPDGRVALSGGGLPQAPAREAADLAQLVGQVDTLLQRPGLASLRSLEIRALTLRFEDARAGRAWTVDGGRVLLTRAADDLQLTADLALLSGSAGVATLAANYASTIGSRAASFGITIDGVEAADIATQGPAFAWLRALRAPISGALRSGVAADGTLAPLNATLQIGSGVIQPTPQTKPVPIDGARSYFSYDPATRVLTFDELSLRSQWVSGRAEGQAFLEAPRAAAGGAALGDLVGQFRLTDLTVNPADLYPQAVRIDTAEMDFRLALNPFVLTLGRLQIADQGGVLTANATLAADPGGWRLSADAGMDGLTPARLLELWPQAVKPRTRDWLDANLSGGVLRDIDVALRKAPGQRAGLYLSFDFDGADIRVMKTLPVIDAAQGHASLLENRFVLAVDHGTLSAPQGGEVDMAGSSFIIPDVTVKGGAPAIVRLSTRSTITAALSLLNQPPMQVMDKAGQPVTVADGRALLQGTVALPLMPKLPPGSVEYDVAGTLLDVRADGLVPGRVLAAPRLSLTASNEAVRIGGPGRIDGVNFDAAWLQPLGPDRAGQSSVSGTLEVSERTLDTFNIALPPGSVRGQGTARIDIALSKGQPPRFDLRSDLVGLRVAVDPLNWRKAAGTAGSLAVAGHLGAVPVIDRLAFDAPGLSAAGSVTLAAGGGLDRVRLEHLRAGDWLDAPIDLVGRGAGVPPRVVVRGGTLDLRRAEFGSSGGPGGPGAPLTVALQRLQISDTVAITALNGDFTSGGGLDGSFTGAVNGGATVAGRVVPENGRSAVQLTAQDAGGVLASSGLLRQARGGTMGLTLRPVGSGGAFDGTLNVRDVRVADAPAMAALLNAISIVGLLDELSGTGIYFSEVDAKFRLSPSRVTLTQASAVGPSMGLSMDGVYATQTRQLQMQGVISPVYLLNGIGSILTRKGEGLFGFNYTLRGTADKPSVSVNPLSALAPGMFRDILRAPAPTVPREAGEAPAPSPDPGPVNPPLVDPGVGR
ncbi:hypothetical protein FDT80_01680 [Sulfitobacter sabulilitoris]|uniref:Uncharacterized protein n=1 Tax=Sulfitobacter sabulilitoris TaxID=2562655 RepID=A0A5S3PMK8_9RHOB|nr:hypothetical protein FDT80_01680 [Sulfitobacter sabulilitoris]